jgi:putative hydrolase
MSDEVPDREPDDQGADPQDEVMRLLRAFLQATGGSGSGESLPEGLSNLPGLPDPASFPGLMFQMRQLLAGSEGPVHWELARDLARTTAAQDGDPTVSAQDQRQVAEALRTADLWLDRITDIPSVTARTHAWSRAEWVEATVPTWRGLVEPIAARVADATVEAASAQAPPEMRPLLAGAAPMMRATSGLFFGAQVGQALGTLAREVVGAGDIGLPLLPTGNAALLPGNIRKLGEGLGLPEDEIRLYLALREAAHARLVAGVPWLRSHLLTTVEEYARGITVDTERLEEAIREIDPQSPESLQEALSSGLFEPRHTPAQQAALDRLELALALVEGWIDHVVDIAARAALPHAARLREVLRRRRAAGGPAEHTFATLVGLELRPRRLREAAEVWSAVAELRGPAERDRLWSHPDLVPAETDLVDPRGFAEGLRTRGDDAMDVALQELLADGAAELAQDREDQPGNGREDQPGNGREDQPGNGRE